MSSNEIFSQKNCCIQNLTVMEIGYELIQTILYCKGKTQMQSDAKWGSLKIYHD